MYCLVKKLWEVKKELKKLHRSDYSRMQSRIQNVKQELDNVQLQLQSDSGNRELWVKEKELQSNYAKLVNAELTLLKQKAKAEWLRGIDANTAFFHASIKERAAKSRITSICNAKGERLHQEKDIAREFVQSFRLLFGVESEGLQDIDQAVLNRGPKLTEMQQQALCRPVTEEEVYDAVFSIDSRKAPGPDGFSSSFFKSSWEIVKEDLVKAVKDFFAKGKMLKQVNCTLITLVPKVNAPNFAKYFRPISCCNVMYKVITKIIANRMQDYLGDLISYNQGAFVKSRSIMDNILICQDLVHNYHRNDSPARCLLKIDLQKAYDMVD